MVGGGGDAEGAPERSAPGPRCARGCRRRRSRAAPPPGRASTSAIAALAVGVARRAHDDIGEVRPIEPGGDAHRVAQPEPDQDVAGDAGRRGLRLQSEQLARPERPRRLRQLEVVGPEVVAPLGDAVRLVDHEHADADAGEGLDEPGRGEALGRDVQQPHARPRADQLERLAVLADAWRCELISTARPAAARSRPATWSVISDTSGETTTVTSLRISAGSW